MDAQAIAGLGSSEIPLLLMWLVVIAAIVFGVRWLLHRRRDAR